MSEQQNFGLRFSAILAKNEQKAEGVLVNALKQPSLCQSVLPESMKKFCKGHKH